MTEWLLTQEEGEKRVYEYMVEERQMVSVERGHWEQLVPVLANAQLRKIAILLFAG